MVASLTPWRLATSATLSLSASRRIRTICSSLYRFFFMCFSRSKKPLSPNYGGSKKPGQVTATKHGPVHLHLLTRLSLEPHGRLFASRRFELADVFANQPF